jgi:hypothetical protein
MMAFVIISMACTRIFDFAHNGSALADFHAFNLPPVPTVMNEGLVLHSTQPMDMGILSINHYAGDVTAVMNYSQYTEYPARKHYEALLLLVMACGSEYNLTSNTGPRVQLSLKQFTDATQNSTTTWFTMEAFNDSSATPSSTVSTSISPRMNKGAVLMRRDQGRQGSSGTVSALFHGDAASPWSALNYPRAMLSDPCAESNALRVGVWLDSNYNAEYSVGVRSVEVRADHDGDGLLDEEEASIGTSPLDADTDGDGLSDLDDTRPLDSSFRWPLDIEGYIVHSIVRSSAVHAALGAVQAALQWKGASAVLLLNNSANTPRVINITLPECTKRRQAAAADTISIAATADAISIWMPPFSRRAYPLPSSWSCPIVNQQLLREGLTIGTIGSTMEIDLYSLAASVSGSSSRERWRWTIVNGSTTHAYTASIATNASSASSMLVVRSAVGGTCADGVLVLQGSRIADGVTIDAALPIAVLGGHGPELVVNGNFSQAGSAPVVIDGWRTFAWQGTFEASRTHAAFGGGEWAAVLHGYGTGKYALMQTIPLLHPGRYTLRAVVAACDATQPGLYADIGRFTLYAAFGGADGAAVRSAIGDVELLPSIEHGSTDGKVGWRWVTANFSLPRAANMTLYFRAWASGWFLVDDVSVRLDKCAPYRNISDALAIANRTAQPLNFTPPLVYEDLLLCGYCAPGAASDAVRAVPPYSQLKHCARCRSANRSSLVPRQANISRALTTFAVGTPPLFSTDTNSWRYINRSIGPTPSRSALLFAGKYMVAAGAPLLLRGDWSSWFSLRIQYRHSSSSPQQFYVELDDVHSSNYWDRLNWYTYLPPAPDWQTAMVPLHQASRLHKCNNCPRST